MDTHKVARTGGLSLGGVLLIVFVVLKLTGKIDWSWLWVLAPLWIPVAIILVLAMLALAL